MKVGAVSSACFSVGFALLNSPIAAYCLVPLLGVQMGAIPSYRALYAAAYGEMCAVCRWFRHGDETLSFF
jgi:hypothetical protein